jgi:hypothetical protein
MSAMGVEDWSIASAIEGPIPSDRILFTRPVEGLLLNTEDSIWSAFTWMSKPRHFIEEGSVRYDLKRINSSDERLKITIPSIPPFIAKYPMETLESCRKYAVLRIGLW